MLRTLEYKPHLRCDKQISARIGSERGPDRRLVVFATRNFLLPTGGTCHQQRRAFFNSSDNKKELVKKRYCGAGTQMTLASWRSQLELLREPLWKSNFPSSIMPPRVHFHGSRWRREFLIS